MSPFAPFDAQTQVLLIDDNPHLCQALRQTLDLAGLKVATLDDVHQLDTAQYKDWSVVVISDTRMPGINGMELLRQLHEQDTGPPVVLITGHGDVPLAVRAMRGGTYNFLEKSLPSDALFDNVRHALEARRSVLENRTLHLALAERHELHGRPIGRSAGMRRLREQAGSLVATQADILILGETGAGKGMVARVLRDLSSRCDDLFVTISVGILAESVVESELFGHEADASTDAQKRYVDKFEYTNGGTLFLDEVESVSLDVQVKLLRLLQERVVERLGPNQLTPLDVRIIAATKENLRQAANQGRFRTDLYYRLNVAGLRIPSLREHGEDIPLLFRHFAEADAIHYDLTPRELDAGQSARLLACDWPGNVRELQSAAERFALDFGLSLDDGVLPDATDEPHNLSAKVEAFERSLIAAEPERSHNSLRSVAEALGIPRKTLHDKLRKHDLPFNTSGENPPGDDE